MSEEVKLKVSMPMFEEGELERFNSNIHSIVEEYSKMMFKEKDQILTQRIIMKQEQEIERLNHIINELEKWLDKKEKLTFNSWNKGIHEVQRKLQELKGDGSNENNNI